MVSKVRNVRLGVFSGGGCHHPNKCSEFFVILLIFQLFKDISGVDNTFLFRYHPVIETTEEVNLDTLLEKLKSKIVNGYSSVRQAFLVFDEVSNSPPS